MSFAGIKKPDERADVIAYLRTLVRQPGAAAPGAGGRRQPARRRSGAAGSAAEAEQPAAPAPAAAAAAHGRVVRRHGEERRRQEGRGRGAQVPGLPQPGEGPGQQGRARPLRRHRHADHPPGNRLSYSQAFQDKGKTGFTWTYDNLNQFLTNPREFIPGTKMTFAGIKKEQERADVVAYLRTLADTPAPFPAGCQRPRRTGAAAPAPAARRRQRRQTAARARLRQPGSGPGRQRRRPRRRDSGRQRRAAPADCCGGAGPGGSRPAGDGAHGAGDRTQAAGDGAIAPCRQTVPAARRRARRR